VIATISTFVSEFTDGVSFDAVKTHEVLIAVCVLGSVAVGIGILLESWPPKLLKDNIAIVLVIGGVVVEALFTIFLFVFDEGISRSQQSKIASLVKVNVALEKMLMPRSIPIGKAYPSGSGPTKGSDKLAVAV
jgi:hypothetical protein